MRRRDPLTPEQERELDALDRAITGEPVEFELRELEDLVRDVRATAPEMSPAFAARLESEVQDGFPTSQERVPATLRRPWRGRRWMLLPALGSLTAVLVALVVVFGTHSDSISGGSSRDVVESFSSEGGEAAGPAVGGAADSSGGDRAGAGAAPDVDTAGREPAPAPVSPSPSTVAPDPAPNAVEPAPARKVERGAVLALRTSEGEFERTTAAVLTTVARFDGIVASSQIGESDATGGEATYDLRIPTDQLDRALAALSTLGHVTERSQILQDITAAFTSTQERLTDARAERRGLLRALERATTQGRIDSLKARLRAVSRRLAGLEGQLTSLRRRADLSRVDLTVRGGAETGGTTGGGGTWTPGDAAGDALRVLEVLAGVALVALAVLVPPALLGVALALAVRGGRRRRRENALDAA